LSPEASIRTIRASMIQGNVTGEVVLRIPWTRHVSEE
jgi:hypothetical protein